MATSFLDVLASSTGKLATKAVGTGKTVPRIYGRCWVPPVLLYARTKSTQSTPWTVAPVDSGVGTTQQCVDAILALGQAGLTILGARINGAAVGRYHVIGYQGARAWVPEGGTPDPYWALLCAFSRVAESSSITGGVPGNFTYRYTTNFAAMEVLNATGSSWGKRTTGVASAEGGANVTVAHPTWTDITDAPAWAHLAGTEWEGLAYLGLTTIRCEGVPLLYGMIPSVEVQVDGIGGENCSPVTAIRDIAVNLMRIPDAKVITDVGPDGTYASSYEAWCAANLSTFGINAAIEGEPGDLFSGLLQATCSESVPLADGGIRIQPLGDTAVGDYTPASTAYVVGTDDIAGEVVEVEDRPDEECPNYITVGYTDPSTPDTETQVPYLDDFDVARTRLRVGDSISSKFITTPEHAAFVAQWTVKRLLRNRKTWRMPLTLRFLALEQGDLLEVHDARLPVSVVRVVTRDPDIIGGVISVEAEEWNGGTHPVDITPDLPAGLVVTTPSQAEVEAAGNAAAALVELASISSDNVLSAGEKSAVIRDYTVLVAERDGIETMAMAYGIQGELFAYGDAADALDTYMATLTSPTAWNDPSGSTTIDGPTFRSKFEAVYTAKQALLDAIMAASKALADRQVGGGNLLLGSAFKGSTYSAPSGHGTLPEGWGEYNDGGEACAYGVNSGGPVGTNYVDISWSVLNTNTRGICTTKNQTFTNGKTGGAQGGFRAGQWYVASWYAAATGDVVGHGMGPRFNNGPDDQVAILNPGLTGAPQRYAWKFRWTSSPVPTDDGIFITVDANVASAHMWIACPQVEEGEVPTSYSPSTEDAQATADLAILEIGQIASDNVLSSGEKSTVLRDYNVIATEYDGINAQADAAGVSRVAYNTAVTDLVAYLDTLTADGGGSGPTDWNDVNGNTVIDGPTFRSKFEAVYTAKQALLDAISGAKAAIDFTNVGNGAVKARLLDVADINATGTLTVPAANITGKLTAEQIEAVDLAADHLTIGGVLYSRKFVQWSATISGGGTTWMPSTGGYDFTVNPGIQPDSNYVIWITASNYTGAPPNGAFTVKWVSKNASNFAFTIQAAPGSGNSVTFDVVFMRI